MTLEAAMQRLESLGNQRVRELNAKNGAGDNQFGVKMGDIRTVAKEIKSDHDLGLKLWHTGNVDAMLLATLVMKPKLLSDEQLEQMTTEATYGWLADWLTSYVVKQHPDKEALRQRWMWTDHPMLSRAGWSLTTERVVKDSQGLDITELLDRIDHELASAPAPAQWTMNFCLIEIGVRFPDLRDRAIEVGERHGLYRDYPVSKGCTSPFAAIAIRELASRKA